MRLAAGFAVEKLAYVLAWLNWLSHNDLGPVYASDFLDGVFYSIYGLNDFVLILFFILLIWCLKKHQTPDKQEQA